jgi:hypothetical protein
LSEIYWVIGQKKDIGKTSIASALIETLNKQGIPTVGFKPFAGMFFHEGIDFLVEENSSSNCAFFGTDSMILTQASPLTDKTFFDIVCPWQMLIAEDKAVLIRSGSSVLNNVELLVTPFGKKYLDRPDISRIIKKSSLLLNEIKLINTPSQYNFSNFNSKPHEKIAKSFSFLKNTKPQAIVCEGAARFIPVWGSYSNVNHIFLINEGVIYFYKNLNIKISHGENQVSIPMVNDLLPLLNSLNPNPLKSNFYMSESKDRQQTNKDTVSALLQG